MKAEPMVVEELLTLLEGAVSGLLFPSESDYPLTPFRWGEDEPTPEALLQAEGLPADALVETESLEEFFRGVLEPPEGADEQQKAEAERYQQIAELLDRELTDIEAHRLGTINIPVYVLGKHPSGEWVGLRTQVVET